MYFHNENQSESLNPLKRYDGDLVIHFPLDVNIYNSQAKLGTPYLTAYLCGLFCIYTSFYPRHGSYYKVLTMHLKKLHHLKTLAV